MPATAYVVAAPCRADMLSATLRSAYAGAPDTRDSFADMIAILDTVELGKRQR